MGIEFSDRLLFLGMAALAMAVPLALWAVRSLRGVEVLLGAVLLLTSFAPTFFNNDRPYPTIVMQLQHNRQLTVVAVAGVLLLAAIPHWSSGRRLRVPIAAAMLVAVYMYADAMRFYHEGVGAAIQSMAGSLIFLIGTIAGTSVLAAAPDGAVRLVRAVTYAAIGWAALIAVQALINRGLLMSPPWPVRFIGFNGTPQRLAIFVAFMAVVMLWQAMNAPSKSARAFPVCLLLFYGATVVLSGSRTGLLLLLVGVCVLLSARLKAAVLLLPIVAGVVLVTLKYGAMLFQGADIERAVSLEDTRTKAWMSLISDGFRSPLLGAGPREVLNSENSLLWGFALYGVGMLMVMSIYYLTLIAQAWSCWRTHTPEHALKQAARLYLAVLAMYVAGSMLEGYILLRLEPMNVFSIIAVFMAGHVLAYAGRAGEAELVYSDHEGTETGGGLGPAETVGAALGR